MSDFALPIQAAIYTRLNSELTVNVYDDVPAQPAGMPDSSFPYVVIGEDDLTAWDTDDTLGSTVVVTLHIWSRYSGKKEVKEIMQEIYTALNRQAENLTAAGYRFVDSLHDNSLILDDNDGKTRHGICRYRITIEKE